MMPLRDTKRSLSSTSSSSSEVLLKKIDDLEASHAYMKQEMTKIMDNQREHRFDEFQSPDGLPEKKASHETSMERVNRLESSQRSHSVSPQKSRIAVSRRADFQSRHKLGRNPAQRAGSPSRQTSRLQQERGPSQSTTVISPVREEPSSSEKAAPEQFMDRHYINILQSMGQSVYIYRCSGEITYWYVYVRVCILLDFWAISVAQAKMLEKMYQSL
eukprot:Gb_10074 [translate_table: standard]